MSVRALMSRVANMVSRAVVRRADDAGKLQTLQVDALADETRGVERFQNYGLTSVPPSGSEGRRRLCRRPARSAQARRRRR